MSWIDIILISLALSMDACAVGMTDGMTQPTMKFFKMFIIALFFGIFQAGMPLLGFYLSSIFSEYLQKIAPYLSFILLAFIGGKMIYDAIQEGKKKEAERKIKKLGIGQITIQAIATSLDALAIGVTFLAMSVSGSLKMNIFLACGVIGAITLFLSFFSIWIGKKIGDKISGKGEIVGGIVLILIGIKILVQGIFF